MKSKLSRVLLAAVVLPGAVLADDVDGWRPFLSVGLTRGGDVLQTTQIIDTPRTQRLYAGNLLQLGVGGLWGRRASPWAFALSVNYHLDDNTGANGGSMFTRIPLEAIAYYVTEDRSWRAGLGLRYGVSPREKGNFPEATTSRKKYELKFENTKGLIAETGWAYGRNTWLNLRAVKELYGYKSYTEDGTYYDLGGVDDKVNGSHLGVNVVYAF